MGLPYILGGSDPKEPENGWEKTWEYLKDLGQYVDNCPSGTGQVISNMADGSWTMIPTTTGWDINPRGPGQLPAEYEAAALDEFTWVTDAHYAVFPVGQRADKISALLNLLNGILEPEYNAIAYDEGYFYPGPALEGATLDLARAGPYCQGLRSLGPGGRQPGRFKHQPCQPAPGRPPRTLSADSVSRVAQLSWSLKSIGFCPFEKRHLIASIVRRAASPSPYGFTAFAMPW